MSTVHLLWLNNFRYAPEQRLRQHLRDSGFSRRVTRNADVLKVACGQVVEAAIQIVTIGDGRWRNP